MHHSVFTEKLVTRDHQCTVILYRSVWSEVALDTDFFKNTDVHMFCHVSIMSKHMNICIFEVALDTDLFKNTDVHMF